MSLIQDEINKASAPDTDSSGGGAVAKGLNKPLLSLLLIFAAGLMLIGLGALLTYVFLASNQDEAVAEVTVEEAGEEAVAGEVEAKAAGLPLPDVAPVAEPEATVVTAEADVNKEPTVVSVSPDMTDAAGVETSKAGVPAVETLMRTMRVSGVRLSGENGSRVIINGKVFTIGDRLPAPFELELIAIAEDRLEFRDPKSGVVYRRRL